MKERSQFFLLCLASMVVSLATLVGCSQGSSNNNTSIPTAQTQYGVTCGGTSSNGTAYITSQYGCLPECNYNPGNTVGVWYQGSCQPLAGNNNYYNNGYYNNGYYGNGYYNNNNPYYYNTYYGSSYYCYGNGVCYYGASRRH